MVNLKNDMDALDKLITSGKKIVLYGAGASCRLILKAYYENVLKGCVPFIVDGNEALDHTYLEISENEKIPVISLREFVQKYENIKDQFVLLMTPYHSLSIVKQLDRYEALDHVEVYLFSLIVNQKMPAPFSLSGGSKALIPKIIHYIWFGEKQIPEEDRKNIESWRKFCPDYEIRLWTEENYDCSKNRYCYEALKNKQYMYATDYARKDILYQYGGIYLDTDVELCCSLDKLLYNHAFIGIEDGGQINSGSGLGAMPHHPMIKKMMDLYQDEYFVKPDGSFNYKFNTYYETNLFLDCGFQLKNEYQKINDMVCFPREVLMPESVIGLYDTYTERTVSNHKINPYDKTERRLTLVRCTDFVIYGAGIVAMSVYRALKSLYQRTPEYFLVSEVDGNPVEIDGIPVIPLEKIKETMPLEEIKGLTILIAVPETHHLAIRQSLLGQGAESSRLVFFTNKLENSLMEEYYCHEKELVTEKDLPESKEQYNDGQDDAENCMVFQAKCHVDKPLAKTVTPEPYIVPIQVGAALTELSIAEYRDDKGDHISDKNPNYCELTATYYAWKNCNARYKGLCHYRRVFDLESEKLKNILARTESVDAILPYPSIYYPDIQAEHVRYVKDSDWQAMCRALEEVAPDYFEYYRENFQKEQFFYNFNMLIAKKEIFDDYCSFLFSVLERTEQLTVPRGWERNDRFAGYLGENLTTIYFRKNKDKLKIVHVGKKLLV